MIPRLTVPLTSERFWAIWNLIQRLLTGRECIDAATAALVIPVGTVQVANSRYQHKRTFGGCNV
jgi:hypothetical protein